MNAKTELRKVRVLLRRLHDYWSELDYRLAKLGDYLGPENSREEKSPRYDASSGVDCWFGRLRAARHMA